MSERETIRSLEKYVTSWLHGNDVTDFRWITESERGCDDNFATCLIVDGDALYYLWDLYGLDELNQAIEHHGFCAEPQTYVDICFYSTEF